MQGFFALLFLILIKTLATHERKKTKMNDVKALFFDVGGTVFDWKTTAQERIQELADEKGLPIDSGSEDNVDTGFGKTSEATKFDVEAEGFDALCRQLQV